MSITIVDDHRTASEFADPANTFNEERIFVSYTSYEQARWALAELWEQLQRRLQSPEKDYDPVRLVVRQACLTLLDAPILDYVVGLAQEGHRVDIRVTLEANHAVAAHCGLIGELGAHCQQRWLNSTHGRQLRAAIAEHVVDVHLTGAEADQ